MSHDVLQRTVRLLRASWRGQLLVLAAGAIAFGLVQLALAGTWALACGASIVQLMVGLAARIATRSERGYDTTPEDVPGDLVQLLPRLAAQTVVVLAPAVAAWSLTLLIAGPVPALALLAMIVIVPLGLLLVAPLLLVAGAVASGDRGWLPRHAVALSMRRSTVLGTHALAISAVVAATVLALPLVLAALVVATLIGPLAPIAYGLAAVSVAPLLGCAADAGWFVLGGDDLLQLESGTPASSGADAFGRAAPPIPGDAVPAAAPLTPDPEVAWAVGATWDLALETGAAWGTWIRLSSPVRGGLRVQWHAGAPPEVALASADGTWRRPGELPATGEPLLVDLEAGDTYVQLTSRAAVPQSISAALLVPGELAA